MRARRQRGQPAAQAVGCGERDGGKKRRAYGFRTPEALIALAMLSLGGLCPRLPLTPGNSRRPF